MRSHVLLQEICLFKHFQSCSMLPVSSTVPLDNLRKCNRISHPMGHEVTLSLAAATQCTIFDTPNQRLLHSSVHDLDHPTVYALHLRTHVNANTFPAHCRAAIVRQTHRAVCSTIARPRSLHPVPAHRSSLHSPAPHLLGEFTLPLLPFAQAHANSSHAGPTQMQTITHEWLLSY